MIKTFLYCNGQGVGYREIYADNDTNELRYPQNGELPRIVSRIWGHLGANAVCGYSDDYYYFLIKNIEIERHDDQGRDICMNLAFLANEESKEELTSFVNGFFKCFNAAVKEFASSITFASNLAGYELDFKKWYDTIDKCINNILENDKLMPLRYNNKEKIQFLFLQYTLKDFEYQTEISEPVGKTFSADEYKRIIGESLKEFPSLPPVDDPEDDDLTAIISKLQTENAELKTTLSEKQNSVELLKEKLKKIENSNDLSAELEKALAENENLKFKLENDKDALQLLKTELKKTKKCRNGLLVACLVAATVAVLLVFYIIFGK